MSFLSKLSFTYSRLSRLKVCGLRRTGKRKISIYSKKLAEEKSKDSGAENVEKESRENSKDENSDVVKGEKETDDMEKSKDSGAENVEKESREKSKDENSDVVTGDKGKDDMEEMIESHRENLRHKTGYYVTPNNLQKIALLWAKRYPTREAIPEFVVYTEMESAGSTVRTVLMYWILLTMFVSFVTLIQCGNHRKNLYHEQIYRKQQEIFREREERFVKQLAESKK